MLNLRFIKDRGWKVRFIGINDIFNLEREKELKEGKKKNPEFIEEIELKFLVKTSGGTHLN